MTTNFDSMHGMNDDSTYMPNPNKRLFHDALELPYSESSSSAKPKKKESQRYDPRSMWTAEEDKLMRKILKDVKPPVNWKRVAEHFPEKNDLQCQTHWEKLTNPELYEKCKKKPWTEEEDALVVELVHKYGPQKWTFIADHLPGRIGKQCRERWHNHLNPQIKKSAWTDDEEWLLFLSHKAFGSRWAEITKNIPGRTDNSIKNHWNSSMKKKIPELSARFMRIRESGGLSNPHNISNISKLEYTLLEKILSMTENEYHVKNENSGDVKKTKTTKNSRNYDSKGRCKASNAPDLNTYNPFNSSAKIDEMSLKPISDNTTSSPNSTMDSLRKLQSGMLNNSDPKAFDNSLINTKLDFSVHEPKNPEHIHLINQMYHPQGMHSLYNNAPHPNIVSTRPHFDNNGTKQNEGSRSGQYYMKEFGTHSPAPKLETKTFGNEVPVGDQFYHGHQNNENKNTMNYSKGENLLFESPPQKKKQKFNVLQSPSIPDSDSAKTNPKTIERMNKPSLNLQGFPKDYISYNAYAYSPLHMKYESPSKMMNFCTPERGRDSLLDSAGKQIFYSMNPIDKSPSLFMNKNYSSFDLPSTLKF